MCKEINIMNISTLLVFLCPLTHSSSGKNEWIGIWKSLEQILYFSIAEDLDIQPALPEASIILWLCIKMPMFAKYLKVSNSFLKNKIDIVIDLLTSWVLYSEFIFRKKMCYR